jgi:hypothetical protein
LEPVSIDVCLARIDFQWRARTGLGNRYGWLAALTLRLTQRSLDHSRRLLRLAVHDVTQRAVPEIRAAVQAAISGYGERLIDALRETEVELEAACDRARVTRKGTRADLSDHEQLVKYRCRL